MFFRSVNCDVARNFACSRADFRFFPRSTLHSLHHPAVLRAVRDVAVADTAISTSEELQKYVSARLPHSCELVHKNLCGLLSYKPSPAALYGQSWPELTRRHRSEQIWEEGRAHDVASKHAGAPCARSRPYFLTSISHRSLLKYFLFFKVRSGAGHLISYKVIYCSSQGTSAFEILMTSPLKFWQ